MFVERSNNGWVVQTPAKINLALEVLGREPDGYHQVETLLAPVRLFDTLHFCPSSSPLELKLHGTPACPVGPLAADPQNNLAVRAVQALSVHSGHPATGKLTLHKRIPSQAGLGGGSSDAAAALVAANAAWGLDYDQATLHPIAASLGTDVPFFLGSGAAIGTGRGERIARVRLGRSLPLVVVKPLAGLPTPAVFGALELEPGEQLPSAGGRCAKLAHHLAGGQSPTAWRHLVHNGLQGAATKVCDSIAVIAKRMNKLPVLAHQMTGSGSAYFAICRTWNDARRLAARLRGGPWSYVLATQTCN